MCQMNNHKNEFFQNCSKLLEWQINIICWNISSNIAAPKFVFLWFLTFFSISSKMPELFIICLNRSKFILSHVMFYILQKPITSLTELWYQFKLHVGCISLGNISALWNLHTQFQKALIFCFIDFESFKSNFSTWTSKILWTITKNVYYWN